MKPYYWCFTLTCVLVTVAAVEQMQQTLECGSRVQFWCELENITIGTNFSWTLNNGKAYRTGDLQMKDVTILNNSVEFFQRLPASFIELHLTQCRIPQLLIPPSVLSATVSDPIGQYELIIPNGYVCKLLDLQLPHLTAWPHNLDKLTSLIRLCIHDSPMDSVLLDSLEPLTNLTKLNIYNSSVNIVQSKGDLRLSNLGMFSMSKTNLTELDMHRWDFPVLDLLELKQNRMTNVPIGIGSFPSLNTVDLSFNFIQHLNMHDFHGLSNLDLLLLEGNQLVKLYSNDLVILPKLQYLGLERNQLELVDFANISISTKYFQLNLACNLLPVVHNWPLEAIDWEVSFFANPWKCDFLEDTFGRKLPHLMPNEATEKWGKICDRRVRGICCYNYNPRSNITFVSASDEHHHCESSRENGSKLVDILPSTYMRLIRMSTVFYGTE